MPNWCSNTLTVEGEPEEIKRFSDHAKGYGWQPSNEGNDGFLSLLDWNKFVPMPQEVIDNGYNGEGKLKGVLKGYDWETKNWGTKWGACDITLWEHEGTLEYSYETAWSPGDEWFIAMGEMFPKLEFSLDFFEYGQGYKGNKVMRDGKLIDDIAEDITIEEFHDMGCHEDDPNSECPYCDPELFLTTEDIVRKEIDQEWAVSS